MTTGIALFGGAFDPFHTGHEAIIIQLSRLPYLKKIWLIPTHIPPHKAPPLFSPQERFDMTQAAAHHISSGVEIEVSDIEIKKNAPSWTRDTVEAFQKLYPKELFYIVIGSDNFFTLHTWKSPEVILNQVKVIVINRGDLSEEAYKQYQKEQFPSYQSQFIFIHMAPVTVSSQHIREKLKNQGVLTDLIPPYIEKFLQKNSDQYF